VRREERIIPVERVIDFRRGGGKRRGMGAKFYLKNVIEAEKHV